MTIADVPPSITYASDGVTTTFAYPFRVFSATDIVVMLDGVEINSFSVTGVDNLAGGTIVFLAAPAAGELIITRSTPLARVTDYIDGGDFRAKAFNDDGDRFVAIVQQINKTVNDIDFPELPPPVAGRQIGYDASGDLVTTAYNADETRVMADAATVSAASALAQAAAALAAIAQLQTEIPVRPDPEVFVLVDGQTDYVLPSHWPVNITYPGAYILSVDGAGVDLNDYSLVGADGRTIRLAVAPAAAPGADAYKAGSRMTVRLFSGLLPASFLPDGSVTTAKVALGAITAALMAAASVATAAVQDRAITTDKEADGTPRALRIYNASGRPAVVSGTSGKLLGFDGTGLPVPVDPPIIPPQTGGLIRVIVDVVAGTRNYVRSAGLVWAVVELIGGGGGGGYGTVGAAGSNNRGAGGGGGGGYCRKVYANADLAASVAYTVGAAGVAGASTAAPTGTAGGATIFLAARANGGSPGSANVAFGNTAASNASGGTATGGDINETGDGGKGIAVVDTSVADTGWHILIDAGGAAPRSGRRGGNGGISGSRTGATGMIVIWEFK